MFIGIWKRIKFHLIHHKIPQLSPSWDAALTASLSLGLATKISLRKHEFCIVVQKSKLSEKILTSMMYTLKHRLYIVILVYGSWHSNRLNLSLKLKQMNYNCFLIESKFCFDPNIRLLHYFFKRFSLLNQTKDQKKT